MKIYNHINEFKKLDNAVVTIGTFDGVHIGHRKIIARLKEVAQKTSSETVILTFFPHPRMILHPEDNKLKLITTLEEKADLLHELGINHLIITPFTRDFSNQSPEEYIKHILIDKIGTRKIVIGYDHRFGKDRKGGLDDLVKFSKIYGFEVEEIPEQDIQDVAVSSTRIRNALLKGDVEDAAEFLDYPFLLTGKVIKGDQIGRQLGFPTANLFIEENYKLIPADGIYAVEVELKVEGKRQKAESGKRETEEEKLKAQQIDMQKSEAWNLQSETHQGMAYIGHRPTINGMTRNIEVNIFDFNQDIYGETLSLKFKNFIRHDIKFDNLEQLKVQLKADEVEARKLLNW